MSNSTIPLPKRPKPIMPIVAATTATLFTAIAVFYFATGQILIGSIWTVSSVIWWFFTLPSTMRSYQARVEIWEMLTERTQRLNNMRGGQR